TPVFLAFHHWVGRDGIMVDNESEFRKIIEPYNVKILLTGHGHSDLLWTWDGIHATMNKGLYQLSYEIIEVEPAANSVRMSRRTLEAPAGKSVLEIPLSRETHPRVWTVPHHPPSGPIEIDQAGATQYRWDNGHWLPAAAIPEAAILSRIPNAPEIPGT